MQGPAASHALNPLDRAVKKPTKAMFKVFFPKESNAQT
jgi:hypothetical protein